MAKDSNTEAIISLIHEAKPIVTEIIDRLDADTFYALYTEAMKMNLMQTSKDSEVLSECKAVATAMLLQFRQRYDEEIIERTNIY